MMNGVGGGGVDDIARRSTATRVAAFTPRSSFTGAQLCKLLYSAKASPQAAQGSASFAMPRAAATDSAATSASPQLICAVLHMCHALAMGIYMSVGFRLRSLVMEKEAYKAMLAGKTFKVTHGTQLNNTEWTPYYLIALLYLHTQQAGHAYTAYASVLACVAYTSVKLLTNGKPTPLIAFMRYNVLMVLIYEVYSTR